MVGVMLVILGCLTIGWGQWLAPRRLRQVRDRATPKGAAWYDAFTARPLVRGTFRVAVLLGWACVVIGVVFLVTEL
jgi:hypothetical protein